MKCLTVQQPWASLLLHIAPSAGQGCAPRRKDVENRTWSTPHRGDLLIHAAQRIDRAAMEDFYHENMDDCFPRGVILGMVQVDDMIPPGVYCGSCWGEKSQWNWLVSRPRVFPRYVPIAGAQGLFDVDIPLVNQMVRAAKSEGSTAWWDGLSEADREWFVERVGILEYEAGYSRPAALYEGYAQFIARQHSKGEEDHEQRSHDDQNLYFGVSESWWHAWDASHA